MDGPAGETIIIDETGIGQFQVEVTAGSSTFLMDEPVEAGGLGSGPNPYDMLSSALGACTLMTLRVYARRKGWALERAQVRVTHHRDSLDAKDRFVREIQLVGNLDEEQRGRLLDIAMRCPVHRTLERGSTIDTQVTAAPLTAEPATSAEHARDVTTACEQAG